LLILAVTSPAWSDTAIEMMAAVRIDFIETDGVDLIDRI
jgi:hypothetical protein